MHVTLWKTLTLRLHQQHVMPLAAWEKQLAPVLSNLHSLVCRSTGRTGYSLFLGFPRRSRFMMNPAVSPPGNSSQSYENDVPDWLHAGADSLLGLATCNKDEALVVPVVIQEGTTLHKVVRMTF